MHQETVAALRGLHPRIIAALNEPASPTLETEPDWTELGGELVRVGHLLEGEASKWLLSQRAYYDKEFRELTGEDEGR